MGGGGSAHVLLSWRFLRHDIEKLPHDVLEATSGCAVNQQEAESIDSAWVCAKVKQLGDDGLVAGDGAEAQGCDAVAAVGHVGIRSGLE